MGCYSTSVQHDSSFIIYDRFTLLANHTLAQPSIVSNVCIDSSPESGEFFSFYPSQGVTVVSSTKSGHCMLAFGAYTCIRYGKPSNNFSLNEHTLFFRGSINQSSAGCIYLWKACVLSSFFIVVCYYMKLIDSHTQVDVTITVWKLHDQPLLYVDDLFATANISTGTSACTRSVFSCLRSNRNGN